MDMFEIVLDLPFAKDFSGRISNQRIRNEQMDQLLKHTPSNTQLEDKVPRYNAQETPLNVGSISSYEEYGHRAYNHAKI